MCRREGIPGEMLFRSTLWDDNFRLGWIDRPPYENWPVGFPVYPNFMVRWMSGESRMEGRLGYESTRERALVWIGHHLETNELVPWSSLTIGDHWLSANEFQRRALVDRERSEALAKEKEDRRIRADEAAIAREKEASLKDDERVRVERDRERAKELEKEKRRIEAESKSGKKKRRKTEVGMPSGASLRSSLRMNIKSRFG